jgi:hypothetical protein
MKVTRGKRLTEVTKLFKPLVYVYTYWIFAQQMVLAVCVSQEVSKNILTLGSRYGLPMKNLVINIGHLFLKCWVDFK